MNEEKILKEIEQNPDSFLAIEHNYFNDLAFIADALEVAEAAQKKLAKKYAKETLQALTKDKKRSKNLENCAKLNKNDIEKSQNESFANRVMLKFKKEEEEFN